MRCMEPGTARLGRYRRAHGCFTFTPLSFAALPLSLSGGGLAMFLCVPLALGGLAFVALLLCHAASRRLTTTAACVRLETFVLAAVVFCCMIVSHAIVHTLIYSLLISSYAHVLGSAAGFSGIRRSFAVPGSPVRLAVCSAARTMAGPCRWVCGIARVALTSWPAAVHLTCPPVASQALYMRVFWLSCTVY